jgi:hypothetical protein
MAQQLARSSFRSPICQDCERIHRIDQTPAHPEEANFILILMDSRRPLEV